MFYVEQNMKTALLLIFYIFLSSCVQKVANPELSDLIYKDLQEELALATKTLEEEEKSLVIVKKERELAVPQTGQIKFSNKKVSDTEERLILLRQQKLYFEIKLEQRKHYVHERYHESLGGSGRPWPDKEEDSVYASVVKFNRDKITWDKNKGMKKLVPRGTEKK